MAARKRNKPVTSGYKPVDQRWVRQPRDLPIMSFVDILHMLREPTVKLGLAMRAAPLANAEFAYKEDGSDEWIPGIKASSPVVGRYVHRQLKVIWDQLSALDTAQIWGWSAAEVMLKQTLSGTVEVGDLLPRHANDTRAVVFDGKVGAIRFNRIEGSEKGYVELAVNEPRGGIEGPPVPKAIFHTFNPDAGAVYGTSVLEGAFSPWVDKWHKGGALDVRRLTMVQNSISGRKLWYPDGSQEVSGYGTGEDPAKPVPNSNIAQQIVQQMMAGAVATLPSDIDDKGNQRWQLEEAKTLGGLEYILKYPQDLDVEILRGMEICDDVVISVEGKSAGSWDGKAIPMTAFYTGIDRWGGKLIRDIRYCILDWLVAYNFGPGNWYEARLKPLAIQAQEQREKQQPEQGGPKVFSGGWGGPGGGIDKQKDEREQPAVRMSLAEGIGQGVIDAAATVKAANQIIRMRTAEGTPAPGSKEDGRWITIGGRQKGDKKHVGGFPVQIGRDGTILKSGGPRGLVGKKISEAGSHFEGMRKEKKQQAYRDQIQREMDDPVGSSRSWKVIAKSQAEKWDMDPETYAEIADNVWRDTLEFYEDREAAKAYARKSAGLSKADIDRMENSRKSRDSASVKGFDVVAEQVARNYPSLGLQHLIGDSSSQLEDAVWELIKEGRQDPPSRLSRTFHDKVEDYLQRSLKTASETDWAAEFDPSKFDEEHPDYVAFSLECQRRVA